MKNDQQEAFERVLVTSLARVLDFLKFAEAKNAALLTFASAWIIGSINLDEVSTILSSDFSIEVRNTGTVPHSSDPAITFPNLDLGKQATKLIDTCVLYIDIRRSTVLNLTHKPKTVAKLYSAFVRAMTRCARHHRGHVRGIIGDRVMVLFDQQDAFKNAVECAYSMNTVSRHIINKHFKQNEVECGIGIDAGKMLVTKTGVRKKGVDQASYRNLVWLGRPANVASKLTDLANKPEETITVPMVSAGFRPNPFASLLSIGTPAWEWREIFPNEFVQQLSVDHVSRRLVHSSPTFQSMFVSQRTIVTTPKTGPILMTEKVWSGYKKAMPNSNAVTGGYFNEIKLSVPGYQGKIFSGDVIYPALK
ncbi:adenylate/guanylate cyclase domain-containing protein [Rhizobium hidalgonense]|uniref:adenylate/guanylate cyclase domain-containing protein n=1 Tax=Rhizobium hidalgonense TaxID=1538159 RepID=UPI00287218A8|nr:adenylate/guanylate cyclase domain-containing protein [Rhizobium hidalgonense]MDR9820597.1 adenylate/guanylate cyclase domain-containing protein [Rhizobium hidalgonense]